MEMGTKGLWAICCFQFQKKNLLIFTEVDNRGRSTEKVFLQISQNSQENTCAHKCFPVNFAKILRTCPL